MLVMVSQHASKRDSSREAGLRAERHETGAAELPDHDALKRVGAERQKQ